MDALQPFDGIAFSQLQNAPAIIRTGYAICLDQLRPALAALHPMTATLLRVIYTLIDGGFAGVRELQGAEPSAQPSLSHLLKLRAAAPYGSGLTKH